MSGYIKLAEAPRWVLQYPTCSACAVDLEYDEGWTCPVCGTQWDTQANDGDVGTLYEAWSGETLDGPPVDDHAAMKAGIAQERARRDKVLAQMGIKTR